MTERFDLSRRRFSSLDTKTFSMELDRLVSELLAANQQSEVIINLSDNFIDDECLKYLTIAMERLRGTPLVTSLNLANNRLSTECLADLKNLLAIPNISEADIHLNYFSMVDVVDYLTINSEQPNDFLQKCRFE